MLGFEPRPLTRAYAPIYPATSDLPAGEDCASNFSLKESNHDLSEISDVGEKQNDENHLGLRIKCQVPEASQLGNLGPSVTIYT